MLTTGSGSGTLFFSGCTLRCVSCQNCQISSHHLGTEVDTETLVSIFFALEAAGASNLNIVTGSHFAPDIVRALRAARDRGIGLPVVWNTAGYECIETLELLEPVIDVWLTDLKTLDTEVACELMRVADYPEVAVRAICWMVEHAHPRFDGDAMTGGVIVRHLILPGVLDDTEAVIRYFAERLEGRATLSVMAQFLPVGATGSGFRRMLTRGEYDAVLTILDRMGIEDGFVQELTDTDDWAPDFTRDNPFPSSFADPVWHWRRGFLPSAKTCR